MAERQTATLPDLVDTDGTDPGHVACALHDRTWCGLDSSEMPWGPCPERLEEICRVCWLVYEMIGPDAPCPICGRRECGS
jgi:hypothetical protein